jgi:hypothetical protein
MIRLWTLQPAEVWGRLQEAGSLTVDIARINTMDGYEHAYEWLRLQMKARLPRYEGGYPWWAYAYKPHLRVCRLNSNPGKHVRLQLLMPREQALLSSYSAWHWVLGRTLLTEEEAGVRSDGCALKRADLHRYCDRFGLEPHVVESWDAVFDRRPEVELTDTIQAVFEVLDLDTVEVCTPYCVRSC